MMVVRVRVGGIVLYYNVMIFYCFNNIGVYIVSNKFKWMLFVVCWKFMFSIGCVVKCRWIDWCNKVKMVIMVDVYILGNWV